MSKPTDAAMRAANSLVPAFINDIDDVRTVVAEIIDREFAGLVDAANHVSKNGHTGSCNGHRGTVCVCGAKKLDAALAKIGGGA